MGGRLWQGILPILEWEDLDVLFYMIYKNIPFNDLYTFGYGRVGCVNCCFRSDYELILNKEFLPSYFERWDDILINDFIHNKKATILNCSLKEYRNGAWKAGAIRDKATEDIIQEFSESQNLNINIARKYFDKTCMCCDKKLKALDIGLSLKYYGRNIEKYKCIKCISKDLEIPVKDLKQKGKQFKSDGCELF